MSLVVPFGGPLSEVGDLVAALEDLEVASGDELVLVDNSNEQTVGADVASSQIRVVPASAERSSYYARNVGVAATHNDWVLFMDADCRPRSRSFLDKFFVTEVAATVGAVAGKVVGVSDQQALAARYSRARGYLDQAANLHHPNRPFAATANLLVRRRAWEEIGGFCEGIRSGGDREFCWRLQDAGWELALARSATVEHRHRTTLRALLRLQVRYGAGTGWLVRRCRADFLRARLVRSTLRDLAAATWHTGHGRGDEAIFSLINVARRGAWVLGYALENRPAEPRAGAQRRPDIVLVLDSFPEETGPWTPERVRALSGQGLVLRVEAAARARRPQPWMIRDVDVTYGEDDGLLRMRIAAIKQRLRRPWIPPAQTSKLPGGLSPARRERIVSAQAKVVAGEQTTPAALLTSQPAPPEPRSKDLS